MIIPFWRPSIIKINLQHSVSYFPDRVMGSLSTSSDVRFVKKLLLQVLGLQSRGEEEKKEVQIIQNLIDCHDAGMVGCDVPHFVMHYG